MSKKAIKLGNQEIRDTKAAAEKLVNLLLGKDSPVKEATVIHANFKLSTNAKQAMKTKVLKVARISTHELQRLMNEGFIVIVG